MASLGMAAAVGEPPGGADLGGSTIPLIPRPARVTKTGGGVLDASRGVRPGAVDPSIGPLLQRFESDLRADGLGWFDFETDAGPAMDVSVRTGPGLPDRALEEASSGRLDLLDESHALRITHEGIVIDAAQPVGVFRALTTLRQLLQAAHRREGRPVLEPLEVSDRPRYPWRGLCLDVVRCFVELAEVERIVDLLSYYKLNVLHLHLTDDQGWRLEIPGRERLTRVGGQGALGDHPGGFYTLAQFEELVRYAAARFVTVVPEIDLPGHAGAAIAAYPELAPARGASGVGRAQTATGPANERLASVVHPDGPGVLDFVRDVLIAVAEATPGPYLHIGGDEVFGLSKEPYRRFVDQARAMARSLGKTPIAWQEAAASNVGEGDIIQHWRDPAADLAPAIERGAKVLLSPTSHLYLDRPYGEASTDPRQDRLRREVGFVAYPRATVEDAFSWDPAGALDGGDTAVIGVEAAMWTETIANSDELEFMLLPRLAGVAEKAWSSPPAATWDGYKQRLGKHRLIWTARGWNHFCSSLVPWDLSKRGGWGWAEGRP